MKRYWWMCLIGAGALIAGAGCQDTNSEMAAAPEETEKEQHRAKYDMTYDHMTDNALLEDMTISDYHFLPHRPALSSLGEVRLKRLVALIRDYGGTIRFNTDEDANLVEKRLTTIKSYLNESGLDSTSEVISAGMQGGAGMDAAQVIAIRAGEGTYKPKKSAAKAPAAGGASNGSSAGGSGSTPW